MWSIFHRVLLLVFLPAIAGFVTKSLSTVVPRESSVQLQALKTKNVDTLLRINRVRIEDLATVAPDTSEITRLRFALAFPSAAESKNAIKEAMAYRSKGKGKSIIESAEKAYNEAIADGGWKNDVVRDAAPHAEVMNKYIMSKNIVTMSTEEGDILYVIRASAIEDKELMDRVSVDQLSDFFMYVKEIHNLVANERSERTGRYTEVIFANDISGVRKAPDSRFMKGLSSSSKQYETLYPSLAGPTLIVNLPFVLQAFVGLIKPLFPKPVQERLKFVRAPVLRDTPELTPLTYDQSLRKSFLDEVEKLVN